MNRNETVYFAAAYNRAAEMRQFKMILEPLGWEVTSSWINHDQGEKSIGADELAEPVPEATEEIIRAYRKIYHTAVVAASDNLSDLFRARTVIIFTRTPSTSGGYHTELGLALGAAKRVIIIGPRLNVFHALPVIEHFDTFHDFLDSLTEE